jgi:L-asparagine permease
VALAVSSTVFAYAAVEMVGTAAGETARPAQVVPRAITSVFSRLAVIYVGSLAVLALLLPCADYQAGTSPFVTVFNRLGSAPMGTLINIVIITAALSSLNAGLYSTGRVLHAMAVNGSAPAVAGRMSARGVPYGGILLTGVAALAGVALNAWVPARAFEIGLGVASLGVIASWAMIVACQLQLWRQARRGDAERPPYRMWGAPYTGVATLVFLMLVPILMALDYPDGTFSAALLFVIGPALMIGWYATRRRVLAKAARRGNYQGDAASTVAIPDLRMDNGDIDGVVVQTRIVEP